MTASRAVRLPFVVWLAAMLMSFSSQLSAQDADFRILNTLQENRTPAMNCTMQWTSNTLFATPAVPLGFIGAGLATDNQDLLRTGYITGVAWVATFAITEGLKFTVRRPRPYKAYPDLLHPVKPTYGYSFPSGHTSLCFATAVSISLCYPKWYVVVPSMLWATGVGFSRLYLGVHYPSDVAFGAVVGTLTALVAYRLFEKHSSDTGQPSPAFMIPVSIAF